MGHNELFSWWSLQSTPTSLTVESHTRLLCRGNTRRVNRRMRTDAIEPDAVPAVSTTSSPWLTVTEAADRARCGPKLIYREVKARRLRAACVGGRRELRLLPEWVDTWLLASTTIQ
jgi:excisionase family DNA binding protein